MADNKSADKMQKFSTFNTYASEVLAKQDKLSPEYMALLISCMDYRYPHRIVDVMDAERLTGAYDHLVLAGASLGALVPDWREVLFQHIRAALALDHKIKKIVILDHRDCGAYKKKAAPALGLPSEVLNDILKGGLEDDILPSTEFKCHCEVVSKLIPLLKAEFAKEIPNLKIDAILLTRDEDDEMFRDK